MVMDNDANRQIGQSSLTISKDFFLLIPLLGSALAVTYDVGFFVGVNLHLFSLFSLSEHIVFALEALPPALLIAFLVGLANYFRGPIKQQAGAHSRISMALAIILTSAVLVIVLLSKVYVVTALIVVGAIFITLSFELESVPGRAVTLYAAATTIAFVFGYNDGVQYLYPSGSIGRASRAITTIETKSDGKIDATVMRSGERGVLFFDVKNKQVTLLRWDEIKQISTANAP